MEFQVWQKSSFESIEPRADQRYEWVFLFLPRTHVLMVEKVSLKHLRKSLKSYLKKNLIW